MGPPVLHTHLHRGRRSDHAGPFKLLTGQESSTTMLPDSKLDLSDVDTMTRTISHTVVHQVTVNDVMLVMILSMLAMTHKTHFAVTTNQTHSVVSNKSPMVSVSGLSVIWPTTRMVNSARNNQPVKLLVPTHGSKPFPTSMLPTNSKVQKVKY